VRFRCTVLTASFLGACAIVRPQFDATDSGAVGTPHTEDGGPSPGIEAGPTAGSGSATAGREGGTAGDEAGEAGRGQPRDAGTDSGPIGGNGSGGSSAGVAGSTAGTEAGSGGAGAGAGQGATGGTTAGASGSTAGSAGTVPPEPPGESNCYDALEARPVCQGFEQPIVEPWWEAGENGTVNLTSAPTYIGDGALAAHAMMGQARFVGRLAWPSGIRSGSIYLRAYVYVPASAVIDTAVVLGMSEIDFPYGGVTVALKDTGTALDVHPEGAGKNAILVTRPTPFHLPRNRWNCVQLAIGVSAEGSVRLTVNGTVAIQSEGPLATLPGLGFRGLSAGLIFTDELQPAIDVYIDELVADTSSIPCDPPPRGPLK
jgi:hypothetical protein